MRAQERKRLDSTGSMFYTGSERITLRFMPNAHFASEYILVLHDLNHLAGRNKHWMNAATVLEAAEVPHNVELFYFQRIATAHNA